MSEIQKNTTVINNHIDAFLPPEMALRAENIGIKKALMGPRNTFALGILAGAYILPVTSSVPSQDKDRRTPGLGSASDIRPTVPDQE